MAVALTEPESAMLQAAAGEAAALAMRIVVETARLLGADRLVTVAGAHIDGALYHGDSGVYFAEKLTELGARVAVPTSLNVGALDLIHRDRVRFPPHRHDMALRLMRAYEAMGCRPSWTCAPYQAGFRPGVGQHVAWGESNAVAFANSVLGARTNRLGDFLDIACAITGRAPDYGLHRDHARSATIRVDVSALPPELTCRPDFYPVLGAWLGATVGAAVAVIDGLAGPVGEDELKALGAAAASTGAVALFHVAGTTPEAPTASAILSPDGHETIVLTLDQLRAARSSLSTAAGEGVDAIALGSPHFSVDETERLLALAAGRRFRLPVYVCTGRHVIAELDRRQRLTELDAIGVTLIADTCVVVAPILPAGGGVLMTNSGKFAFYAEANTGFASLFASLDDCVATALAGRLVRNEAPWH